MVTMDYGRQRVCFPTGVIEQVMCEPADGWWRRLFFLGRRYPVVTIRTVIGHRYLYAFYTQDEAEIWFANVLAQLPPRDDFTRGFD